MRYRIPVAAVLCILVGGCKQNEPVVSTVTLGERIRSAGYTDLALPTSGYAPGTLVTYQSGTPRDHRVVLRYLCHPDYMTIPDPIVDHAQSTMLNASLGGNVRFQGLQLSWFDLGASANAVENVTLQMKRVQALEQPIDKLREIRAQKLGPTCEELLTEYKRKNLAFQSAKALKADISYTVSFKSSASIDAKSAVIQRLNQLFNASIESSSTTITTGEGIFYGILVDPI